MYGGWVRGVHSAAAKYQSCMGWMRGKYESILRTTVPDAVKIAMCDGSIQLNHSAAVMLSVTPKAVRLEV